MLTERQHARNVAGGEALRDQRGSEHYSRIGKLGGRPSNEVALETALQELAEARAGSRPGRPRKQGGLQV